MRISREHMFMDICEILARRATCFRGNSGALIVRDNDIISCGYNGPPAGDEHCKGTYCELNVGGGCLRSLHAEANAVRRAQLKQRSPDLSGCVMFTLHSPCSTCAEVIILSGIGTVYYRHPYRLTVGLDMLMQHMHSYVPPINVFRITQAGMIIDHRSNQLCT